MTEVDVETQVGGHARRRARTRAALIGAARELLVEGRESASVEEITRRAGVGFGSLSNHFPEGKDSLFAEAVLESLDAYATWIRSMTQDIEDPAEVFARGFRVTGRLALAQPELITPLLARGTEILLVERGLRDTALEDITEGVRSGRFVDLPPDTLLMLVGGTLLGLVRMVSEDPAGCDTATVDAAAAAALRLLGVREDEAAEIVTRDLPDDAP